MSKNNNPLWLAPEGIVDDADRNTFANGQKLPAFFLDPFLQPQHQEFT